MGAPRRGHSHFAGAVRTHHVLHRGVHPHRLVLPVPGRELEPERQPEIRRGLRERFARPGDDADLIPDVWIGRVPSQTAEEARIAVDKVLAYEIAPPVDDDYPASALMLAEVITPQNWAPSDLRALRWGDTLRRDRRLSALELQDQAPLRELHRVPGGGGRDHQHGAGRRSTGDTASSTTSGMGTTTTWRWAAVAIPS